LEKELKDFAQKQNIQNILLTLSELGVLLYDKEQMVHLHAQLRNISDVSGAGDTVISVAALALTFGLSNTQIAFLANLAGGLVCEEVGVVPINLEKLKNEYFKLAH
jgi:bifunctional ADP-heptose synthase (sugar kinase/adenylyltransferase)